MLALGLTLMTSDADAARKKRARQPAPDRYGSIVIDADTGNVLLADRADRKLHPASLTKMMTLLLTFEALAEHRLRPGDYIRVSSRAANVAPSKLGIPSGGALRVDEAIQAVTVKSANDISVALAEALGGSESKFAEKMNARARSIGMVGTRFVNASGLPDQRQISTPRDMALLARYIITNYPQYYGYFGKRSFYYAGRTYPNHNKLMNAYPGMDGMKTGYVNASGYNLVASARQGNRRLIGVVFGGKSANSRNQNMADLLNQGFKIKPKPILEIAKTVVKPPPSPLPVTGFALADNAPVPLNEYVTEGSFQKKEGQSPEMETTGLGWAVQIGAYQSRLVTDRALDQALRQLPRELANARAVVAPLKSESEGWLFRARLGNLTQDQAKQACSYFRGCLLIAPERF